MTEKFAPKTSPKAGKFAQKSQEFAVITGKHEWDGGTVALLEIEDGRYIAAEPRMADDVLTAHQSGEVVTIEFEPWQVTHR